MTTTMVAHMMPFAPSCSDGAHSQALTAVTVPSVRVPPAGTHHRNLSVRGIFIASPILGRCSNAYLPPDDPLDKLGAAVSWPLSERQSEGK